MNAKSLFSPLLVTAASFFLLSPSLWAATFGKFTYTDFGDYIVIDDYPTSEIGVVVIPATIVGKPVTSIGDNAFYQCIGLTSVTIPSSVTSIKRLAFYGCSGLTSVTIRSGVTSIGEQTFWGCWRLTSVTIPSSVTRIGDHAFVECRGLTSVTIPSSVTNIGVGAFGACSGLTSVTIHSGVTSIGIAAFENCIRLRSVTIPSSVTSIEGLAFSGCSGLTIAVFLGNAPTMGIDVFPRFNIGFPYQYPVKINYITGKTGFTTPTWYGYPCVAIDPSPEIDIQQPLGSRLADGYATKSFGTVVVGQSGTARNFFLKNTGTGDLTGLAVSVDGTNAGDFLILPPAKSKLLPGASTTFKVTFIPTASGTRSATLRIQSNDADENPFDIKLKGLGVAP